MDACTCGLALLCLSVAFITTEGAPTTQAELDNAASNLKIDVYVNTMHEIGQGYDVAFRLTNTGKKTILVNTDWIIEFCMKGSDLFGTKIVTNNGLNVAHVQGCTYYLRPSPSSTGKKPWKGVKAGKNKSTTVIVRADGLSVFRSDFFPRFVIKAHDLTPRNVESTNDDSLAFVHLAPRNATRGDFSRMSGVRRSITAPIPMDLGRVPWSIVMPSPKSIVTGSRRWIDLAQPAQWYIWPDSQVSEEFKNLFVEKLSALPNMTRSKFTFVTGNPPAGSNKIYLQISASAGRTIDGYTIAVIPRDTEGNIIHISASDSVGLQNALESLLGVTGLFTIVPAMTINDDARFGLRSIQLDVTTNFLQPTTVKKLLALMKKYKLNNLVLKLADDLAWRLEMPREMDFAELTTFASKRCADKTKCLPAAFGSGADENSSGSGFYSQRDFADIIQYAKNLTITVTPMINVLGGIRSAKKASHLRYERLKAGNKVEADRLHLMTAEPSIPKPALSGDVLYTDGLLDPCNPATTEFIKDIIKYLNKTYGDNGVEFNEFHAGGDELTKFYELFPSCKTAGTTTPQAMRNMLQELETEVGKFNAKLRVKQEAVIDPDTKTCLTPSGAYNQANIIAEFWDIMPGNQDDWGLSASELDFINAPVPPYTNGSTHDPLLGFLDKQPATFNKAAWSKKGIAPWARGYDCANNGYKVVLSPESFTSLDSAYELDFDELGNRKKNRFHIINLHRMMMFEPLNLHTNMDTGNDGYRYLPYRLCHIWECVVPLRPENIIGLSATIDTDSIRNEAALWEAILPEMLLFAEKAWREAPFENILRAEDPNTLINMTNIQKRAYYLNSEIMNFTNCFGYKESGILDYNGYTYRVSRPGSLVDFGLPYGALPPYGLIVKIDMPGADIEYRTNRPGSDWQLLYERIQDLGIERRHRGGYNISFGSPANKDLVLEIRAISTDGKRRSITTKLDAEKDVWPPEIPVAFREGTCLPIKNASMEDFEMATDSDWQKIFRNVPKALRLDSYRRGNVSLAIERRGYDVGRVLMELQAFVDNPNTNISSLPADDILRIAYEAEKRETDIQLARLERMEQEYQACKNGGTMPGGRPGRRGPPRGRQGQGQRGLGQNQGRGRGLGQGGQIASDPRTMQGLGSRGQNAQSRGMGQGQGRVQGRGQGRSFRNAQG